MIVVHNDLKMHLYVFISVCEYSFFYLRKHYPSCATVFEGG